MICDADLQLKCGEERRAGGRDVRHKGSDRKEGAESRAAGTGRVETEISNRVAGPRPQGPGARVGPRHLLSWEESLLFHGQTRPVLCTYARRSRALGFRPKSHDDLPFRSRDVRNPLSST